MWNSDDLERANKRLVERTCRVGPNGDVGTIQKIYQRRGRVSGTYGAVVLMLESGTTRWVDLADVDPF
jgi:hypothetical protein